MVRPSADASSSSEAVEPPKSSSSQQVEPPKSSSSNAGSDEPIVVDCSGKTAKVGDKQNMSVTVDGKQEAKGFLQLTAIAVATARKDYSYFFHKRLKRF